MPQHNIAAYAHRGAKASATVRGKKAAKRADDILPIIEAIQAEGNTSLRQIAAALNERGITTARGNERTAMQVKRILDAV